MTYSRPIDQDRAEPIRAGEIEPQVAERLAFELARVLPARPKPTELSHAA